jgi:glycosyltransferase involved in cell wall biosynthesis
MHVKNLKIAFVANSMWNLYNFRRELIRHLKSAGHEIFLIAAKDEYFDQFNQLEYSEMIFLKNIQPRSFSPLDDFKLLKQLIKIYRQIKPDLILHYTVKPNIYGSIAARICKVKCIANITGLGYTAESKLQYLLGILYKISLSRNSKVVFHNQDDLRLFLHSRMIHETQAVLIPGSGIDVEKFSPQEKVDEPQTPVILFCGRLLKEKGIIEFVEAAKQIRNKIPEVVFVVIGKHEPELRNSVSQKDLTEWIDSNFIQYKSQVSDVRPFYAQADIIVLPSYREGLSKAVLEAMSMEKPVIVTDVPGCRDLVIHGKNGLLIPPKDVQTLVTAIIWMIHAGSAERKLMGRLGRSMVIQKFELKKIIQAYDEIILNSVL